MFSWIVSCSSLITTLSQLGNLSQFSCLLMVLYFYATAALCLCSRWRVIFSINVDCCAFWEEHWVQLLPLAFTCFATERWRWRENWITAVCTFCPCFLCFVLIYPRRWDRGETACFKREERRAETKQSPANLIKSTLARIQCRKHYSDLLKQPDNHFSAE